MLITFAVNAKLLHKIKFNLKVNKTPHKLKQGTHARSPYDVEIDMPLWIPLDHRYMGGIVFPRGTYKEVAKVR